MRIVAFEINKQNPDDIKIQVGVDEGEDPTAALNQSREWLDNQGTKGKDNLNELEEFKKNIIEQINAFSSNKQTVVEGKQSANTEANNPSGTEILGITESPSGEQV